MYMQLLGNWNLSVTNLVYGWNKKRSKKWQTTVLRFFKEKLGNLVVQEAYVFGEVEGQISLLHYELY